jgi:thiol-disulfide isomerase/thioredoxin
VLEYVDPAEYSGFRRDHPREAGPERSGGARCNSRGPSSSRADVTVAYAAALKTGKPIYLLFHSLTCVPCVEISAVVDKVIPAYEGRIVFVNAISDDEPSPRAC